MTREISAADLAWLTGLFEGEGCMSLNHQGRPVLRLGMTDEDVVRRARAIAGVGYVKGAATPCKSGKVMWYWGVGRCEEAAALINLMLPLFGKRRAAKAIQVLASYAVAPPPKRLRTHCSRGHELSGDTVHIDLSGPTPRRTCRSCSVINAQAYRARYPERVRAVNLRCKANAKTRGND